MLNLSILSSMSTYNGFLPRSPVNSASFLPLKKTLRFTPFPFPFEEQFDATKLLAFSRRNYWICPVTIVIYFLFVYYGPKIMSSKAAFDLRRPLKYWNLFLSVFSFLGMLRIVSHLLLLIAWSSIAETICTPPLWNFGSGPSALWAVLFVYSKYFELFDTVFIVLRKRKLTFLHWYHHATVLIFTWDAFIVEQPPGVYFAAMNYTVHSIMYFYYYLAASRKVSPSWGVLVTILQILQMIAGVILTIYGIILGTRYPYMPNFTHPSKKNQILTSCYVDKRNLWGCMGMYSTYFYLFAVFFYERYVVKKPDIKKAV